MPLDPTRHFRTLAAVTDSSALPGFRVSRRVHLRILGRPVHRSAPDTSPATSRSWSSAYPTQAAFDDIADGARRRLRRDVNIREVSMQRGAIPPPATDSLRAYRSEHVSDSICRIPKHRSASGSRPPPPGSALMHCPGNELSDIRGSAQSPQMVQGPYPDLASRLRWGRYDRLYRICYDLS